ncbi:MAG: DUF697 domain-containing protein [Pirellulales bacterium]|nr:DUF697 domain-containing protein [Pirellulales bacterium]
MKSPKDYLSGIWQNLRAPRVDDERLQERLERLRAEMPVPVFWLLGKTQSGKTSIIRALTGSTRTEIGSGFRPCTRTSRLYPFPDESQYFLQFLDTRGLGEVHYDPSEDIRVLENQAHCLIVVVKAMDHAQQPVLEPLKKILKAHPRWPLIVVQTSLHEGYPAVDTPHILPYPYREFPFPPHVPRDLARSLASQRQWFDQYEARFVPVDFTLPEDDHYPEHYGLDALWTALEDAVPLGLRAMMHEHRKAFRDAQFRTAHPHVLGYAAAAGAAAGVPVPMIDIPLLLGIQAKLFHSIASIYGQEMSAQRAAEIFGTLGLGIAVRMGGRELLKFVPGLGSAVSALFAAASTYALGCTLCAYFSYAREGDVPDAATLRRLYEKEYAEGRSRLREYLQHVTSQEPSP